MINSKNLKWKAQIYKKKYKIKKIIRYKYMETYVVKFNPNKNKGVYAISLVNDPAIEEYFVQMSKEYDIKLAEIDKEKRLFMTPVLIPNQKILRVDDNGNPFNIVFEAETIAMAQQAFQKRGYQNESTLEHDINLKLDGVTFVETWVKKDEVHDQSVIKGFNQPIGTWFTIFRVDDDEVMAKIESGEIKGVSIDGAFELDENSQLKTDMNLETILTAIKEGFDSLKAKDVKLGKQMTIDDQTMFFEGDALAVDTMVFANEEMTEAFADGTYEIEGFTVVIAEGKISELTEKVEAEKVEEEEKVEMADDSVEAKVNEIMQAYVGEIAKAVAAQLSDFKTEMKKEQEQEVRLAKANPTPAIETAPTSLVEKMFNELKNK
jgi:hypothetical protein